MVFDWVTFGEPLSFWQMLLRIVARFSSERSSASTGK